MKKTYLIANWKMQLSNSEAVKLTEELKNSITNENNAEIILCPSFTALSKINEVLKGNPIKLGAQNVWYHEKGQYTGEISPIQLKELGVEYVIIGHSERRQHLKETDEDVNRKAKICLDNNITPIVCVGETFDERRTGQTDLILIRQVSKALEDLQLKNNQNLIIAYEPVWVIGSGQAIKPEDAQHVAQVIQHELLNFFDKKITDEQISIIYGGSIDANNVNDFIQPGLIDGVLVGGASLTAEKFLPLINSLKILNSKS